MSDFYDLETQGNVGENDRITQLWGYLKKGPLTESLFCFSCCSLLRMRLCRECRRRRWMDSVYSADGTQLPDVVNVDLCDSHGTVIQQSSAASAGRFYFQGLNATDYVLKISADGFEPQDVHVNLQFGNVHGVMVYLKRIAANSAKPRSVDVVSSHELSMPAPAHDLLLAGRTKLYRENKPQEALDDFLQAQRKAPGFTN